MGITEWIWAVVVLAGTLGCSTKQEDKKGEKETGLPVFYITGDRDDKVTAHRQGLVLAGGGTDVDDAMKWMLRQADGGDVVVLRVSGGDGYNDYFFSELGVWVNSVTTMVIDSREKAEKDSVYRTICRAEVLFIAGGDQSKYIRYWKGTRVEDGLKYLIETKKATLAGTSAGMAVLGEICYTGEKESVTSDEALQNPYHPDVTLTDDFLHHPWMKATVTDTHFSQRQRMGRWVTFMGRIATDKGIRVHGIACDEKTAVCISPDGIATVYGGKAFFASSDGAPGLCVAAKALEWSALKCYEVSGSTLGNHTFDLRDWKTGSGGKWKNIRVEAGKLYFDFPD